MVLKLFTYQTENGTHIKQTKWHNSLFHIDFYMYISFINNVILQFSFC